MVGRAIVGTDEPETVAPLLDTYLARFPKAGRLLGGDDRQAQVRNAVIVWCRQRVAS